VDREDVEEIEAERKRKRADGMLDGSLEPLVRHPAFIPPKEYKQFSKQSKGKFGGVGIQINADRQNGGQLTVVSPIVGTPAYEAGVLAGDLILKIDGKSTESMRLGEAVDMIQGEPGQKVVLTVLHEGSKEPIDLTMARAEIEVQSVLGDLRKPDNAKEWDFFVDKANKIAYVRLATFSETAPADLRKTVEQLQREGMRGLVLDIRNNPGGLLRSAVEISNLFLPEGRIVSTKGRNHKEEIYDARPDKALAGAKDFPIAVLVNRYSASASEIVAAALQDHGRAVVIGERSYGKGSVQNIIEMENHASALKLTTASYWRPSSKNIHRFPDSKETDEWGVKPNDSGYELTAAAMTALRGESVPKEVLAKLDALVGKKYATEKEYLDAAGKVLSEEELSQYKAKLLDRADRGFEVPLRDEERLGYMVYRRDRDIVFGKSGAPAPAKSKTEKEKEKKPFVDRVLERALDHLRGEIKKAEAAPVLPPVADA